MEKDNSNEKPAAAELAAVVQLDALPDEMLEFILTYLQPYRDLECCSLVCKRWHSVVKNLIRRSKMNLHKGLLDFRLRWEVFSQQMAAQMEAAPHASCSSPSTAPSGMLSIIAGRFSHSAVRHGNSMYVFGGGSSSDTTFNDLWRFDLSEMRWDRPLSMGSYPSPKGSASMVSWGEQLVLFGGWRYPSLHPPYQPWCLFDELHFYDLATQRWVLRMAMGSPPPMAGHSATVHGDRMIVFGGYQIADGVNSNSNETWCLELKEQRWWQPRFAGNTKPPPRYGQFQLELDAKHLLVVGGCGGPNSIYSDAWLLDMSNDDLWAWRALVVRNKKFAASHMWCNPACKVDSKLVVLGPTPNMPQDFQMMKQTRVPVGGGMPAPRLGARQNDRNNPFERLRAAAIGLAGGAGGAVRRVPANVLPNRQANGPDEQYFANRRAILNQHQQNANNNFYNNSNNNIAVGSNGNYNYSNNNLQPRTGRLSELHASASSAAAAMASSSAAAHERNQNRPTTAAAALRNDNEGAAAPSFVGSNGVNGIGAGASNNSNSHDIEAANRLQRNLALRCRENEPLLPKRFDELYEDPFRMAAFNVQSRPRSVSRDHNERIRRMEEKMNAIRNSRRNAAAAGDQKSPASASVSAPALSTKEPSPKRAKRNVFSLFVCELSAALDADDPHLQWLEHKNYGVLPGAPERLILATMVAGHGELILFGGVHKETLGEITHQVSNSVHFLSAPRDIV